MHASDVRFRERWEVAPILDRGRAWLPGPPPRGTKRRAEETNKNHGEERAGKRRKKEHSEEGEAKQDETSEAGTQREMTHRGETQQVDGEAQWILKMMEGSQDSSGTAGEGQKN